MSQRSDPFLGAWKLVPELSQFDANHQPSEATMVFEVDDEGYPCMTAKGVNGQGQAVEESPQRFVTDGQPRPLPVFPQLTVVSARPDIHTLHSRVMRPDGSLVGESLMVVSPDGRSLAATNSGVDSQLRAFKQRTAWRRLAAVLAACLLYAQPARAQSTADTVVEWNRILLAALAVPGANPPTVFITRPIAMVHVAMFDALNSIDPQYDGYATRPLAPPGASPVAAAAQAARDVLVALLPSQRATFDAALAATLAPLPAAAAGDGSLIGAAAARAILELRSNDGWSQAPPPYLLPDLAGYWQPTPPANAAATFTHYPSVRGFIISDARQLLVEPPPALTSTRYAADFNEVKAIGSATSTTRTAVETQTAQLWAAVGTTTNANAAWNIALQDLVRTRGLSGLEAARMFALANMAAHDALLVSFTGKYQYGLWRPVHAIRGADRDGNAATAADATWSSLIVNPPYPTYPGNMACLGASQAQVLTRFFGRDNIPVSITWAVAGGTGITRSYNGFRQIADEEARSRILGGIHFTFDTLASFGVCVPLGDYTVSNYLRPRFTGR